MGPTEQGIGPSFDRRPGAPMDADIDVVPFTGELPLSRGAPERALRRKNHYSRRARVTAYEALTSTGTVSLTFQVVDDKPFAFDPGYFVGIHADLDGVGSRQSPYCLSSAPNDDGTFRLIVRLVPEGPVSVFLCGLEVGDVIEFRGPSGRSMTRKEAASEPETDDEGEARPGTRAETETETVLIATGVGIGPLLSFAEHVLPQGFERPIRLYWGLRQVEDICLVDELDELARRYPNFSYDISLSQPDEAWEGLRGRVTETVPQRLPTLADKHFFLVGNGAMIDELSTAISDLGVAKQFVYEEAYFNVKYRADEQTVAAIRERFVASDLFSPYRHQQAGLFMPERPVTRHRPSKRPVSTPGAATEATTSSSRPRVGPRRRRPG